VASLTPRYALEARNACFSVSFRGVQGCDETTLEHNTDDKASKDTGIVIPFKQGSLKLFFFFCTFLVFVL